ncbi:LptM family lipoprotein [Lentibacillus saliphilus]|uniref:LptM family lipoprotein n=1 Tax=Lentibacillus saliphilus TaxID=2737028 RepID=UPI001C304D99|nr:hypothetical protein [Lentibacillus saliphilus]
MKKLLYVMLMMVLAVGLAACGDSDENNNANGENNDQEQANVDNGDNGSENADGAEEGDADEAAGEDSDALGDENYQQIVDLLKDNDFEVTDVQEGYDDVIGSEGSVTMVVNGEDMLALQVYKMEEGHENLDKINESGTATLEFEGQQGDVEGFYAIGNYAIFLAEGHPDSEAVETLLKDNFTPQ